MEVVHDALSESDLSQLMPDLGYVDPGMALQEYETNGQGGLDALLTALDGSSEVSLLKLMVREKICQSLYITAGFLLLMRARWAWYPTSTLISSYLSDKDCLD